MKVLISYKYINKLRKTDPKHLNSTVYKHTHTHTHTHTHRISNESLHTSSLVLFLLAADMVKGEQ